MSSFKAYLARWMAATIKVAPWMSEQILPFLQTSAKAAAAQCNGGTDGVTCGIKWTASTWDGAYGVGQQMSALEVIQSNLIAQVSLHFLLGRTSYKFLTCQGCWTFD